MEKKCPDCGHEYNPELIKQLHGGCPRCMADLLRNETDLLNPDKMGRPDGVGVKPIEVGSTFRGMEIVKLLGRGGMGYVYKARQPHLNRFVALKILDPRLVSSAGFTERFNREAKALAALNHPNIVQVYDYGQEGQHHFLVMELVDGANLREILLTSRIEPKTALRYVPQICDALEYAHMKGVIHRDIKPENILIDKLGSLKIADFGLAKMKSTGDGSSHITQSDQIMGTPSYMAPEQREGASVDHRADIYSLGVVFYEMLTGELPIGRFPAPSERVKVDIRLDEVVMKALEKDLLRRYQNVSQVKSDIAGTGKLETPAAQKAEPREKGPLTAEDKLQFANLLDKIWIAYLISVIGLFIPVIDLYICSILGSIFLASALLQLPQDQHELRSAGTLSVVDCIMLVLLFGVGILALAARELAIFAIPVALVQMGCSLLAYWKIMGKTGSILEAAGHSDVSRSMYSARVGFVVYTIVSFFVVILVAVLLTAAIRPGRSETTLVTELVAVAMLPVQWFFGWLFILRPISWARTALRMN